MEQALILRIDGELTIDTQGVPVGYQIKTDLAKDVSENLQRRVRSWRFEPIVVDGKPVIAQTQIRVTLAARPTGNDYVVTVDNVTFPQTQGKIADASMASLVEVSHANHLTAPEYPRTALYASIEADVVVYIKLTPEGRVEQAFVPQVGLLNVRGKPAVLQEWAKLFEEQTLVATKRWRFNLSGGGTRPLAEDLIPSIAVPIHFRMADKHTDRQTGWIQEARTPMRQVPWVTTEPDAATIGVADLTAGELAPLAARFRLATPVAGSAL